MALVVDGDSEIDHRIEERDESHIELLEIRGAVQVGDLRAIGRTRSLVLRPGQSAYHIRYRANQRLDRRDRCPLWLPAAPTDGRSRSVRLQIALPPGTIPASSMPAFNWMGIEGSTTLSHVPAFVRVPYSSAAERAGWDIAQLMDSVTLAVFAVATALWVWRRRR